MTCLVCGRAKPAPTTVTLPSGLPALLCGDCAKNHHMTAEAEKRAVATKAQS